MREISWRLGVSNQRLWRDLSTRRNSYRVYRWPSMLWKSSPGTGCMILTVWLSEPSIPKVIKETRKWLSLWTWMKVGLHQRLGMDPLQVNIYWSLHSRRSASTTSSSSQLIKKKGLRDPAGCRETLIQQESVPEPSLSHLIKRISGTPCTPRSKI